MTIEEIEEIKKHRKKFELDLMKLIREKYSEFKTTTGISPYAIKVHVVDTANPDNYEVGSVEVSIRLLIDI